MNWMRLQVPLMEWAIALASDVLPVPGTSSRSRWPSLNTHTSARAIWSRLPLITCSTLSSRALNQWLNHSACWSVAGVMVVSPEGAQLPQTAMLGLVRADRHPERLGRVAEVARAVGQPAAAIGGALGRRVGALPGTVARDGVGLAGVETGGGRGHPGARRVAAPRLADGRAVLAPVDVHRPRGRGRCGRAAPGAAADLVARPDLDRVARVVGEPGPRVRAAGLVDDAAGAEVDLVARDRLAVVVRRRPRRPDLAPTRRRDVEAADLRRFARRARLRHVAPGSRADVVDRPHLERVGRAVGQPGPRRRRAATDVLPPAAVDRQLVGGDRAAVGVGPAPRDGDPAGVRRRRGDRRSAWRTGGDDGVGRRRSPRPDRPRSWRRR